MSRKISVEEIVLRLKQVHGDQIELRKDTYVNANTKCTFIDVDHGEWQAIPDNIIGKKQSHPKRRREKTKKTCLERYGVCSVFSRSDVKEKRNKITADECQELAEEMGGKFLSIEYKTAKDYYSWQCKDGHIFDKKIGHIKYRRQWCAECHKANRRPTKKDLDAAAAKHDGLCLSEIYICSKTKYIWKCNINHIFDSTYTNIDFGQWCPICAEQKRINTRIEKYGYPYLMQNKELAIKSSKAKNEITILRHWKDGSEVSCRGSYEVKTVEYLNCNNINYLWQPKTFLLDNGKTYTPDLYLVDVDLWIEIKGYFYGDALDKWNAFKTIQSNSELWDKDKLTELGIL